MVSQGLTKCNKSAVSNQGYICKDNSNIKHIILPWLRQNCRLCSCILSTRAWFAFKSDIYAFPYLLERSTFAVHPHKAHISIWSSYDGIDKNSSKLCKSFPSCTEVCPGLMGTRQLLTLSVGVVTGVCELEVTRWQQRDLGEQWAVRRMQAICSEYCVTAQRSKAERDGDHRAAFISLA